jgi:hypothetical protein
VRYLLQLIIVDDNRVGYLARLLSHIEMFYSGMVTWFQKFTSA